VGAEGRQAAELQVAGGDLEMMQAIKRGLDPKNILNPGRVIRV
jgi:FAD/FMN-containing dehydrogenase